MQIALLIERESHRLTATESRLAEIILADLAAAARSSVAALAAAADTHASSVVRFSQKLGFAGFPEFRNALHAEAFVVQQPAERLRERLASLPDEGIVSAVIRQEVAALNDLAGALPDPLLLEAAGMIGAAGRILVCGDGSGGFLADLLVDRLQRIGLSASTVRFEARSAAQNLAQSGEGDVLVAVALVRRAPLLARILAEAGGLGMKTILLADPALPAQMPPVTTTLTMPRGPQSASQTLVVPLAIISALMLAVSRLNNPESLSALALYGALRTRLAEEGE